jgi:hypothetical protein
MANSSDGDDFKPPTLLEIISEKFRRPSNPSPRSPAPAGQVPGRILNAGKERKAAMSTLDAVELKWAKSGLIVATIVALLLPVYAKTLLHSAKDKAVSTTVESVLISGIVLLFCIVGFIALQRRKRTLVAFSIFITGFAFTLTFAPLGFALIFLGGWLMLRAYRIQKYGTANMKMAAREAASRPPRKVRQKAAKTPVKPSGYTAPKANKRYTPKAPTKKKVPKPTPGE